MEPITPVLPGLQMPVTTFAKDQPQYKELPSYRTDDGLVLTRWQLTWKERLRVLFGGSVWLSVLTFGKPLQPVKIDTQSPLKTQYEVGAARLCDIPMVTNNHTVKLLRRLVQSINRINGEYIRQYNHAARLQAKCKDLNEKALEGVAGTWKPGDKTNAAAVVSPSETA